MVSWESCRGATRVVRGFDGRVSINSDGRFATSILRKMYEKESLCDVALFGEPPADTDFSSLRPIRAHKVVLAHASQYFFDFFTVDGHIDVHIPEYNINNVSHNILRDIISFVYMDELLLTGKTSVNSVCEILVGASHLKMVQLAEACEIFLADCRHLQEIKLTGCISLWNFARQHRFSKLMLATTFYIAGHYLKDLPSDDEFLRMPYADCAGLLTSEPIIDLGGVQLYYAAMAWLNYDCDNRAAAHACEILNVVTLPSGTLPFQTILEANENEMLRKHAPETLRQAKVNALKLEEKASASVPSRKSIGKASFSIKARSQCGNALTVPCTSHLMTVEEVKQVLQDRTGFSQVQLRLLFGRHRLEDKNTLLDYCIGRNAVLDLVLDQRGCMCSCLAHKADEMWAESDNGTQVEEPA